MVLRENHFVEVGLAIMADRKSRSLTLKGIFNVFVGAMKTAIEHMTSQEIIVFQSLGNEVSVGTFFEKCCRIIDRRRL